MIRNRTAKFMAGAVATLALSVCAVSAATLMNLFAYVSFGILDPGGTPLPDGSVVYIFGSYDAVNDGMAEFGGGFIADSTQGDDQLLATVRIGDGVANPNTGQFAFSGVVNTFTNVYIRFFNTTTEPVVGSNILWGTSAVEQVTFNPFGQAIVDFSPGTNLYATNQDNFVVIPEPGITSLLLVGLGTLLMIRRRARGSL